jgi:tryptophan 2,3-dioxygenase
MSDDSLPPVIENPPLTYTSYLMVNELLELQRPLSEPAHHDELLFIQIHQVYEIWFKQLLHEVDAAVWNLSEDRVLPVHKILKRVTTIQDVLAAQLGVLETMTPQDFGVFRERLNPASGFQSYQFRELEYVSGSKDLRYLPFHKKNPKALKALEDRLEAPTIWDEFCGLLSRRGFDVAATTPEADSEDSERLMVALATIYLNNEEHYDLYLVCESMVDYDERFQLWRFGHVKMVERTIGMMRGTGGSSGAGYLRTTLSKRFFPELWDVRSRLGASYGG